MIDVRRTLAVFFGVLILALPSVATAQAFLYTQPDPAAKGGIQGRIVEPRLPLLQVLATPRSHHERVYTAEIDGTQRDSFRFTGLPMDRYDLVVIYDDRFFEGVRLNRGDNTLQPTDVAQIEEIINRSEPFFSVKIIHRLEGQTGRGGTARAVCTFGRERLRRTYKLVLLRQVGPGWQVERTREWLAINLSEGGEIASEHNFVDELSGIRVTDHVRDLGTLRL